jgi:hypothetical protein
VLRLSYLARGRGDVAAQSLTNTPSWIAAGTADNTGTTGSTPAYGTNEAGDLFVLVVAGRVTAVDTPTGWTKITPSGTAQGGRAVYYFTRDTRSSGGETGTVAVTLTATSQISTIHTFRDVALDFIEDMTEGGRATNGAAVDGLQVDAGGIRRLAVIVFGNGDESTWSSLAGESGGDWTLRAQGTSGTGSNASYCLQTAALNSGGTISGGSSTPTPDANEYASVAFALVGT